MRCSAKDGAEKVQVLSLELKSSAILLNSKNLMLILLGSGTQNILWLSDFALEKFIKNLHLRNSSASKEWGMTKPFNCTHSSVKIYKASREKKKDEE